MVRSHKPVWYDKRGWALVFGTAAFILAYAVASRALDTGSLGQYAVVLILLGLGLNRWFRTVRPKEVAKP